MDSRQLVSMVPVLLVEFGVANLMIGLAALYSMPLARCNPHTTVRTPDRFRRIVCFCFLH
jgi:hypothetical protein